MSAGFTDVDDVEELAAYFTNAEVLRTYFQQTIAADTLPKRLFILHGPGGVGKTSLLRMLRLHCKEPAVAVPVALASGEETTSVVGILGAWALQLKTDGIKLPQHEKETAHYTRIQQTVREQAVKSYGGRDALIDVGAKTVSKTLEAAGGVAAGAVIGSMLPGIGTVLGAAAGGLVSGAGEALASWLRSFLNKVEADLYLDPSKVMTDAFLDDMDGVAPYRRTVLMLDTYENLLELDRWLCDFAQRLNANTLLVIAGREMMNWDRQWPGWLAKARVAELQPLSAEVMRALVRRYYATQRGGEPDPQQVEKVIRFARGLPIAVVTAVRLWTRYGKDDFDQVEADAVHELVDRLLEGVPPKMLPTLEAAAAVRYFNKEILCELVDRQSVDEVYDELRSLPFVKASRRGTQPVLQLHASVRPFLDRELQVDDPGRHRRFHQQAAAYFEKAVQEAGNA